jgi:hypothetical protein
MGLLVAGTAIFVVGWICLVMLWSFFPVYQGSEFSPYSFQLREFETGHWLGKTVVQPASLACSSEISKHLTNATRSPGVERWDLVACSQKIEGTDAFEASILMAIFGMLDADNDLFWEKWSKKHPERAKILWPAVQQLAIHRSYFALPELIHFAETNPTPEALQKAIASVSLRAGLDQAYRHLAKQEYDDARITVEWAKAFGKSQELEELEKSVRAGLATLAESRP